MSTIPKQSRQQRALAQRERDLRTYTNTKALTHDGRLRNFTTPEDKAAKAQRDVDALKMKLGTYATLEDRK